MAGGIFISYRRSDSAAFAGRIADFFAYNHKDIAVFFDTVAIQPGDNFVDTITSRLAASSVVLAIIGETWLESADAEGARRIDNPNDFVRMELKLALEMGARVIPVLLDDARMPDEGQLPADLGPLAFCNAELMRGAAFQRDAEHLGQFVAKYLSEAPAQTVAATAPPEQREVAPEVKAHLVEAFTRLRDEAGADDFIIIENAAGQFVQYAKLADGDVMLDLPTPQLDPDQLKAAKALLTESYDASMEELGGGDFVFNLELPLEPAFLSHITLDVFEHIFGEAPSSPLTVTIDG